MKGPTVDKNEKDQERHKDIHVNPQESINTDVDDVLTNPDTAD
jgi:hypothetical protein